VNGVLTIAAYALQEALRRRVFAVVMLLTLAFLGLYWLGAEQAFDELDNVLPPEGIDAQTLVGATLFGLSMFGTLFLGTVLAVFLTLGAVRGDAERGLLQPLVVRPLGRSTFLVGRFLGAAAVCCPYVFAVYAACAAITNHAGGWWPDRFVAPGVELAAAVVVVTALALLGSVLLSATANGIAVFMIFGAGLVAGLLGQIGEALNSDTLRSVARTASWILPFEALYQDALHRITIDSAGFTRFALELGPFGGAQGGGDSLPAWALAYVAAAGALALVLFARRDL
jgi:ABC-type transport system involved in multi-copper enzyme maturation permease subunit